MLKTVYSSVEDDTPLRHISWHKVAATDRGFTIGHFTWVVPEAHLEDEDIRALTDLLEREVRNALIVASDRRGRKPAESRTASDRPAPPEGWKRVTLWDSVHLWLPENWEAAREKDGEDVYYVYDDSDRGMWRLRIQRAALPSPGLEAVQNAALRRRIVNESTDNVIGKLLKEFEDEEDTISVERVPAPDGFSPAGMKRVWASIDRDDGKRWLRTVWHRFAWVGDAPFDVFFEWVIVERVAEEPEMRRLSELVEQEVMQAVFASPDPPAQ